MPSLYSQYAPHQNPQTLPPDLWDRVDKVLVRNNETTRDDTDETGDEVELDSVTVKDAGVGVDVRVVACEMATFVTTETPATNSGVGSRVGYAYNISAGHAAAFGNLNSDGVFTFHPTWGFIGTTDTTNAVHVPETAWAGYSFAYPEGDRDAFTHNIVPSGSPLEQHLKVEKPVSEGGAKTYVATNFFLEVLGEDTSETLI